MMATTPTLREQLLAARQHVVAASVALNEIKTDLRLAGDTDRSEDAWAGVVLLADVISSIDLLLAAEIGR